MRPACPYCTARLLMPLPIVTAVITVAKRAVDVRTWFACYGCRSSFAINVAPVKE